MTRTDLTPSDFCLRGWMKSEVYKKKVNTRDELVARILNSAAIIKQESQDDLRRATRTIATLYIHIYVYIYIYIYICPRARTRTHTHAHTHTRSGPTGVFYFLGLQERNCGVNLGVSVVQNIPAVIE